MDQEDVVHIYTMKYYSVIKKERNSAICNNMDGPGGIVFSEISQTKKDKYCIVSLICGI